MKVFIFKGLRGFYGGILVIFSDIENGENVDFKGFYRSVCRTQNGNQRVDGRDMPFPAIEQLFKNVNHAPYWHKNIL